MHPSGHDWRRKKGNNNDADLNGDDADEALAVHTSQISNACLSDASGSRFGTNSCADESGEARVGDRLHHATVVQLLRVVDLGAAGHAAGVIVRDVLRVGANRRDDVAFHDLHVVDVVQQLEARRRDALHDLHGPRRVVGLVVLVIDLAVQHLEAERDAVLLGRRRDALEAGDAVGDSLAVGQAGAVAAEHHDVRNPRRRDERNHPLGVGDELVVVVGAIEADGNRAEAVGHRAVETVLLRRPAIPVSLSSSTDL